MRFAAVILSSLLFFGGCSANSVRGQQLILTVPESLMEEPAKPKTLAPEAETPKVVTWSVFG